LKPAFAHNSPTLEARNLYLQTEYIAAVKDLCLFFNSLKASVYSADLFSPLIFSFSNLLCCPLHDLWHWMRYLSLCNVIQRHYFTNRFSCTPELKKIERNFEK